MPSKRGNTFPFGVPFAKGFDPRRNPSAGGKAYARRTPPSQRALSSLMAIRKRYGYPTWDDADKESFKRGWQAGFDYANGHS